MTQEDYIDFTPDEEYEVPISKNGAPSIRLACCDCSLVHDIYLKVKGIFGRRIIFSLEQNPEETERLRANNNT